MKTLIMHGSYGSPNENWFRWLQAELVTLGHEVILEQFPVDDWEVVDKMGESHIRSYTPIQSLKSWERYFVDTVLPKVQGQPFNLACHSIAPIFMTHMLEKYDLSVNTAVFVAPFFDLGKDEWHFYLVNKTFYKTSFDFGVIKKKLNTVYVVYGDNDPYVPATQSKLFAEKLNGAEIVIHGGEHCGSIFKKFPLVLELIKINS
jgi:uncharacterized protein